jgi:crossover junction endodeoxyribonuclease RuvC
MAKSGTITKILGIDPGTHVMGYGLVAGNGDQMYLVQAGVKKMPASADHLKRLSMVMATIEHLIETHQPDAFAIEAPFFGKNIQSMLKLGRAQGVAMAVALRHGLPVAEYAPRRVKQAITGNGNASKEQVAAMLENILHCKMDSYGLDATDALGVSVCHYYTLQSPLYKAGKKYQDWGAFIQSNPDKVK